VCGRARVIPREVVPASRSVTGIDPVSTEVSVPRVAARQPRRRQISMDVPSYISGYVDGEGCFTVSFSPRPLLRVGWEVRPSFSVSQNADRAEVLTLMRRHFGCGTIRPDRGDRTVKYEVRSIDDLVNRVIPQFEAFPLLSGKHRDFQRFAQVCKLVRAGAHLTAPGFRQVADLALGMNASGRRRYTLARLIGPSESEVIVSATSNGGST
jgi:LAGLIDADG endonuclease